MFTLPSFHFPLVLRFTDKHCFIEDMALEVKLPVIAMTPFSSGSGHSADAWPLYTMFSDQVNISGCCQDHQAANSIIEQFIDYTKTYWASYYAPCIVLRGGVMQGWIRHTSCPSRTFQYWLATTSPCWKDRGGTEKTYLVWPGAMVMQSAWAGVVRFTQIDCTASHSRDKVVVMLLTLAVSLQQMGREEQNGFH